MEFGWLLFKKAMNLMEDAIMNEIQKEIWFSWNQFINGMENVSNSLREESDRGSVIVGAAILEENLQKLISKRLLQSSKKNDELFSGSYSLLGSFSAKIDISFRIGAISQQRHRSLEIIRKLRHRAAHKSEVTRFDRKSIQDQIRHLFKN